MKTFIPPRAETAYSMPRTTNRYTP
jgi:hypothetical protein